MIKHFLITGDIHGHLTRFTNINTTVFPPEETAIIILGDAGFNYYFDARDIRLKNQAKKLGFTFFCVRGNHESRPEDVPTMVKEYNHTIRNDVYYEIEYPNIFYLIDGLEYWFDDVNGSYKVEIEILANDRNGLLKDIIKQVENSKIKLTGMNTRTTKEGIAIIDISLEVENTSILNTCIWWEGMDSNHRKRTLTDLQSASFSHSDTRP